MVPKTTQLCVTIKFKKNSKSYSEYFPKFIPQIQDFNEVMYFYDKDY